MIPTLALREQAMKLLAADTTTLAPVAANKMALVKATFIPSEELAFADLTLADFDGSTPLATAAGAPPEGLDPATTDSIIDLKAPAGGFRWETTGVTNLPQTIYGYALVNDAVDTVLCAALFPNPIELTAVNQRVEDLQATLRQAANSIS